MSFNLVPTLDRLLESSEHSLFSSLQPSSIEGMDRRGSSSVVIAKEKKNNFFFFVTQLPLWTFKPLLLLFLHVLSYLMCSTSKDGIVNRWLGSTPKLFIFFKGEERRCSVVVAHLPIIVYSYYCSYYY